MDMRTQQKRDGILDQMRRIERLRRGSISEQFYGSGEQRQGPYYVLQGHRGGKHWSRRIPRDQAAQVREDLGAETRFRELCAEFAEVTEQATMAEDQPDSKKNAATRSRSATGKRKHS